jgi:hypothetical protein
LKHGGCEVLHEIENVNVSNRAGAKKKDKSKEKATKEKVQEKKHIRQRSSRLSSSDPMSQGKEEEVLSTLVENI